MQPRNLHNDTLVVETVYKWIWKPLSNGIPIIVKRLFLHIDNRFFHISDLVSKQIYSYHRQSMAIPSLTHNILRVLVLHPKILAES